MQAKLPIFLCVSLVVAACSSGGRSLVPNTQCPANFDPVPMKVDDGDQNKISWEKTTDSLPPGDYQEVGATLYYVDDVGAATNQNFRVKLQEAQAKDGLQVDSTAGCVRNARPDLKLDFATEGVTRMTIDNNKNIVDVETRQFKFNTNQKLNGKFESPQKKTGTEPKAVYQGKTQDAFILKRNDTDYELRSQGRYDNGNTHGTYYLLTTLRRAATPACSDASPLATAVDKSVPSMPLTEIGQITPGTYGLVSTSVYMVDHEQDYRLQVQDKPTDAGVADSRLMCERNVNDKLKARGFSLPDTISQITVDANGTPVIDYVSRRLAFQRLIVKGQPSRTLVEFKKSGEITTTDVQTRAVVGMPTVYRFDGDKRLEIRSRGTVTSGGATFTYEVTTTLKKL